jgi:MFS family permease
MTPSIEAAGPPNEPVTGPPLGTGPRLGLQENWWQFSLYTLVTLLIGMTIGVERVALPPLAHHFGITSVLYTVSFISAFGAVKSVMNLVAGRLSDRRGRKMILLAGWGFALPYALIIIVATAWWQVIVANLFLGVNQALSWTMSVTAKIDLVGPVNRGLAVGVDESAGYIGVGLGGFAAGLLVSSYGLRPTPYLLALGVVVLGSLLTLGPAKETLHFARHESHTQRTATGAAAVVSDLGATTAPAAGTEPRAGAGNALAEPSSPGASGVGEPTAVTNALTGPAASPPSATAPPSRTAAPSPVDESPTTPGTADERPRGSSQPPVPNLRRLAAYMSWHDRSMLAVCQAGFLNKFADTLVAAFFPLYLERRGMALADVGLLVGVYAWVWGLGQVAAGALADRIGRKIPITVGTLLIAAGLALFVATADHGAWFAGAALMGLGMALAYPNLITSVGDVADPSWRGGALGVYRLWRDGGYAVGPLVLGAVAVIGGITAALWAGVALVGASGIILLLLLRETDPRRRRHPPVWTTHPEWVAP